MAFKEYHRTAIIETIAILIFTVFPTIAGLFWTTINSEPLIYSKFYKAGEFLLYSVSLLSSSYIIYNKYRVKPSDWKGQLSLIIVVILALLSLFYAMLSAAKTPNFQLIKWISILLFLVSGFLFYYSQVLSNKPSPDIGAQRTDEQEVIENAIG